MTALWMTPIFENDMPPEYGAYHGYAATDMYQVDPCFGSNDTFRQLVQDAHRRDMKRIMDMIHNHIGGHHWWVDDPPTGDWVHDFDTHSTTNYEGAAVIDPYASPHDREQLTDAWFVPSARPRPGSIRGVPPGPYGGPRRGQRRDGDADRHAHGAGPHADGAGAPKATPPPPRG